MSERRDLEIIAQLVPPGSRVLDLGCGDGELLTQLRARRGCTGYGIELDDANVLASTQRGINVIQLNLEEGLALFDDASFDVVLQLDTLQHLRHTEAMLRETARVGRMGIVSFPNFAHWPNRMHIARGRMPVTRTLPYEWYDTPSPVRGHLSPTSRSSRAASACACSTPSDCRTGAWCASGRTCRASVAVFKFESATS